MIRGALATIRARLRLHPILAATAAAAIMVGGATAATIAGNGGGGQGGGPPRPDLRVRALGDSVTAGFGYYADGTPVPASEILGGIKDKIFAAPGQFLFGIRGDVGRCLPPDPPDGRCQSPAHTAYPAVFAQQMRVPLRGPNYKNLAVSGSTPLDWLGPRFGDELDGIVRDDPDLTVLTLGANPLLQSFLVGKAICARSPFVRRCVEEEIEEQQVEERLSRILLRLLATDPGGRRGDIAVLTYHEVHPIPAFGATVSILLDSLNAEIARAVARARAADPGDAGRLILVNPPDFEDHQCNDDEPWVLLTDSCIHPNSLGQEKFAEALVDAVGDRLPPPGATVAPPPEPKDDLVIELDDSGEVIRVGPFEPMQYLGPDGSEGVVPNLRNAIAAFGRPSPRRGSTPYSGCITRWPRLSLIATSDDFSGAPPCSNDAGVVELVISGSGARRWRTDRGLRVDDRDSRLVALYPDAYIDPNKEHTEILVEQSSVVGEDGKLPRLTATVIDTRVATINVHLYGAGE